MSKVLVVGESWFTHTVHQKGFDSFYTSEYTEGGHCFLDALSAEGHQVTYVPSHEIPSRLPQTAEGFASYDVVVLSDVGANSFQLAPDTFNKSIASADKAESLRAYVEHGGSLLMAGGYLSFSGIEGKARWGRSPLAPALAVRVHDRDDRVELPAGGTPSVTQTHSVTAGLDSTWPALLGLNEVVPKDDATVLAECAGYPLLVIREYGTGRSAAFTSDVAPHWAPPDFVSWDGYRKLFDQLVRWLAKDGA